MPTYSSTKQGYRNLYDRALVTRGDEAGKAAHGILEDRGLYEQVEADTGVPWFVVALIHMRESNRNFSGVLHNGQQIIGKGTKTTIVPKGRGPFGSWHEAAVDAIKYMKLDTIGDWPLERCLYEMERYNGWGYFGKINSPYLWAGTNLYTRGKYVADHQFDPNHVDRQMGVVAVLKKLEALDADIAAHIAGAPIPAPEQPTIPEVEDTERDPVLAALIEQIKARTGAREVLITL